MIALDHIAVWSANLYRTTIELSRATGIGSTDGGYFPGLGLGQKLLSLGGLVYVEVESIVDHRMIAEAAPTAVAVGRQALPGDRFVGLCLRSDDPAEIEAFARHRGVAVSAEIAGGKESMVLGRRRRPALHAPDYAHSWLVGKPNIYHVPDVSAHASLLEPQPGTGEVRGLGVTAIEVGGTEDDMRAWLGDLDPDDLGLEIVYNGGPDGLYAVSFDSTAGAQTLRLPPIIL